MFKLFENILMFTGYITSAPFCRRLNTLSVLSLWTLCFRLLLYSYRKPVENYEMFSETVKLTPKYPGKREIIAGFNSRQLVGITGAIMVEVQEA